MLESRCLSEAQWRLLCDQAEIISSHAVYGPKVILLKTGEYIKVFNHKPGLSKRWFFPKYRTFVQNAARLKALGFRTIEVTGIYELPHIKAHAVRYAPIEGVDFREILRSDPEKQIGVLMDFLVRLHEHGIYFHGMHLGNVVYHAKEFGIIDMADLSFHRAPLRIDLRVRQLRRLMRYKKDAPIFESLGVKRVKLLYAERAGLTLFWWW